MIFWVYRYCSQCTCHISPSKAQRMLKAILAILQLLFRNYNHSLLLYFLVVDLRLFLVSPMGICRASVATMERILRKTHLARSNQAMSSWPGQQDARGGVPFMHYSFAYAAPRRALAQDWILMNLISHLLKARNALSGINESLWVSFGRTRCSNERSTRSVRVRLALWILHNEWSGKDNDT